MYQVNKGVVVVVAVVVVVVLLLLERCDSFHLLQAKALIPEKETRNKVKHH